MRSGSPFGERARGVSHQPGIRQVPEAARTWESKLAQLSTSDRLVDLAVPGTRPVPSLALAYLLARPSLSQTPGTEPVIGHTSLLELRTASAPRVVLTRLEVTGQGAWAKRIACH